MLSKSEIEMLAHSTQDELVTHIRALTPRVREAHHILKRAVREYDRLACMVNAARAILLARRVERRNNNHGLNKGKR